MNTAHPFDDAEDCLLALDELVGWIDESDYSDDMEPRLTQEQWAAAQRLADTNSWIADRVDFLRTIPSCQVLLPDNGQ